jgi:hypothetical protein
LARSIRAKPFLSGNKADGDGSIVGLENDYRTLSLSRIQLGDKTPQI